jgi:hypothetical protein
VLTFQGADTVLETQARKYGAVMERVPPGGGPVLKFSPEGVEVVAGTLRPEGGKVFNFQVAGLLKIVIIGNHVRTLLSPAGMGETNAASKQDAENDKRTREVNFLLLQLNVN